MKKLKCWMDMALVAGCMILVTMELIPSAAADQAPHTYETDADQCAMLPPELQAIVEAMDLPGRKVQALADRSEMVPLIPAVQRLDVSLHPADAVSLAAIRGRTASGRSHQWTDTYAGLLKFTVPMDGVYRISASSRTWIDVLESGQAVARIRPDHRLHRCGHVHKSVEFPLKKGNSYWLEVSGSDNRVIALVITPEQ